MSDSPPSSSSSANSNLSGELPKQYKPAEHEQRIRAKWDAAKAFHADPQRVLKGEAKPYAIVIPPPNVTDRLHLGHALNNTLQDVLARSHRMMGYETLWMPGTDHAGIATQAVVERRLKKDENLTRQHLGREKFIAKVQSFKDEYEAIITEQLKLMGCSCDWDRQRFTMDDVCALAVREAFFRLFKDGLIYRGKRLVNWDPVLQTAVADDECYDEEIDSFFFYLRYPLVHASEAAGGGGGGAFQAPRQMTPVTWNELARRGYPGAENHPGEQQAWVTVATTRPETYLGDTAVAINPKDQRAKSLRGLFIDLPLVGRIIPILEDDYVVLPAAMQEDPEEAKKDPKAMFATGFLKVTPAHDANDYELGFRHKAAIEACGNPVLINIFAPDGSISDKHGWTDIGDAHLFVGLKREAARKKVLEEFKARTVGSSSNALLAETKPYRHSVKHSDRSKAIIEPYLSDQWYVKVTDDRLAPAANRALVAEQRTAFGGFASGGSAFGGPPLRGGSSASQSSTPSRSIIDTRPFPPFMPSGFEGKDPYPKGQPSAPSMVKSRRFLPHIEIDNATYFVTWRTNADTHLTEAQQDLVMSALRHHDGTRVDLYAASVMSNHVHLVVRCLEGTTLSDWLAGVKRFTARQINSELGTKGHLWQDESFDHVIRDSEFLAEFVQYIVENPVEAGVVAKPSQYAWTYISNSTLEALERAAGRTEAGPASERRATKDSEPSNDGHLKFYPSRYAKTYEQWHDNIRDWCISRQLWWGHRVPVWSLPESSPLKINDFGRSLAALGCWVAEGRICGTVFGNPLTAKGVEIDLSSPNTNDGVFICVRDPNDHEIVAQLEMNGFVQDTDVLDTWFSSALWPMSTMGWPNPSLAGKDFDGLLQAFNPTTTLCTAREIITLWVSRMVMFNRYLMPEAWPPSEPRASARAATAPDLTTGGKGRGPLPFRNVFIHAVIQDGEGRKMSKSLGNGLDPLDIIASHGSDAMRFTLCQMTTQTQDVRMPMQKDSATGRNTSPKFDLGRNFANKLWNAARFTMTMLKTETERRRDGETECNASDSAPSSSTSSLRLSVSSSLPPASSLPLVDKWMLSRLATAVSEATTAIDQFEYSNYAQSVYDLLWRDFCDWYLEAIKPTVAADPRQQAVLRASLDTILRLLHPIMPYVTEAIYEQVRLLPAAAIDGLILTPPRKGDLLCTAGWPTAAPSLRDSAAETTFERIRSLVTALREARSQHQVPPKRKATLHTSPGLLTPQEASLVQTLALVETNDTSPHLPGAVTITFEGTQLFLSNLRDPAATVSAGASDAERDRLTKLIADNDKSITTLQSRLNNPGYAQKAPPAMVKQTQDQLAKAIADRDAAHAALTALGSNP